MIFVDRSKKFIEPVYQIWEDMSAEELQEFKKPIKKVNLWFDTYWESPVWLQITVK